MIDRKHDIADRGKIGEKYVCDYLIKNQCKIAAVNYSSRYGEIDIIAENKTWIIFVEVKTRTQGSMVGGFESITRSKIQKITKTAAYYLMAHPTSKQRRIDCAQVIVNSDNELVRIDYIKNAVLQTGGIGAI
ncbi:MAG: YraN family protein [Clostridia bacterium]|nr:YraN family protein [Clostridia bacterium]